MLSLTNPFTILWLLLYVLPIYPSMPQHNYSFLPAFLNNHYALHVPATTNGNGSLHPHAGTEINSDVCTGPSNEIATDDDICEEGRITYYINWYP